MAFFHLLLSPSAIASRDLFLPSGLNPLFFPPVLQHTQTEAHGSHTAQTRSAPRRHAASSPGSGPGTGSSSSCSSPGRPSAGSLGRGSGRHRAPCGQRSPLPPAKAERGTAAGTGPSEPRSAKPHRPPGERQPAWRRPRGRRIPPRSSGTPCSAIPHRGPEAPRSALTAPPPPSLPPPFPARRPPEMTSRGGARSRGRPEEGGDSLRPEAEHKRGFKASAARGCSAFSAARRAPGCPGVRYRVEPRRSGDGGPRERSVYRERSAPPAPAVPRTARVTRLRAAQRCPPPCWERKAGGRTRLRDAARSARLCARSQHSPAPSRCPQPFRSAESEKPSAELLSDCGAHYVRAISFLFPVIQGTDLEMCSGRSVPSTKMNS